MFTGLIEEVGTVRSFQGRELKIGCHKVLEGVRVGDSIACNGVCLSVVQFWSDAASFHVSPTTSENTRFRPGWVRNGDEINLERALQLSDRLGGHLVSGHVDGEGKIIDIARQGEDFLFEFLFPPVLKPLLARKGSVTIDGISLTIAEVRSASFVVAVIPQTREMTNLRGRRVGDSVHVEADLLARYVQNVLMQNALGRAHGGH